MNIQSIVYRFGDIYEFVNLRLYDWKAKFNILGQLVGKSREGEPPLKVLDVGCGTGYLVKYLHESVDYEGWDLNNHFLDILKRDWKKGRIKLAKFIIKQKDIFDFSSYPEGKDVIVLSDVLHHICPRHLELVQNAKKHAKKVIIAELCAVKPKDMQAHDWTARAALFFVKFLPEWLYRLVDLILADNDGINSFDDRYSWNYDKPRLIDFYRKLGVKKIYTLKDEIFGVWEA
ncbi:MAG: class I SAM-dependent methyltransferase [Candidatus Hodarchaeota archaeon]